MSLILATVCLLVTPQVLARGLHAGKEEEGLRGCKMGRRPGNAGNVFRAKDVWLPLIGVSSAIKCFHAIMAEGKQELAFWDHLSEAKSRP